MTTGTWTLRGITTGRGSCDHCGRTLARLFLVTSPDGAEMAVGRTCSAKLTGYRWDVALAERIARSAALDVAAAATYGPLWQRARDLAATNAARHGVAGAAGDALEAMRSGLGPAWDRTTDPAAVSAWATQVLAAAERAA